MELLYLISSYFIFDFSNGSSLQCQIDLINYAGDIVLFKDEHTSRIRYKYKKSEMRDYTGYIKAFVIFCMFH
jgi:hypothetical protein